MAFRGRFFTCAAFLAVQAMAAAEAKDVGTLKVTVSVNQSALIVRNNTGAPLNSCNIIVNRRFKVNWVDIPASGREFRWPEFMTSNDVRFDPSLDRATRIHVLCREGDVALVE